MQGNFYFQQGSPAGQLASAPSSGTTWIILNITNQMQGSLRRHLHRHRLPGALLAVLPETVGKAVVTGFEDENDSYSEKFPFHQRIRTLTLPVSLTEISGRIIDEIWKDKLVLHAPAGSFAEQYAEEHGIPFQALE